MAAQPCWRHASRVWASSLLWHGPLACCGSPAAYMLHICWQVALPDCQRASWVALWQAHHAQVPKCLDADAARLPTLQLESKVAQREGCTASGKGRTGVCPLTLRRCPCCSSGFKRSQRPGCTVGNTPRASSRPPGTSRTPSPRRKLWQLRTLISGAP